MDKPVNVVGVEVTKHGDFCCGYRWRRLSSLSEITLSTSQSVEGDLYKKKRIRVVLGSGARKARYSCLGSSDSLSLLKGRLVFANSARPWEGALSIL